MTRTQYSTLRLILGDQLNAQHSWYTERRDDVLYVIAELKQETSYTTHHIQKLCAFFASMANFAQALSAAQHHVLYLTLDDTAEHEDLPTLLTALCGRYSVSTLEYQHPDEYRLATQLSNLTIDTVAITSIDTEHFLLAANELNRYVKTGKHNRMESFYRKMRKRFDILMEDDQPLGGQWNYDGDNRNKLKKTDLVAIPDPLCFSNDMSDILTRIHRHSIRYIGENQNQLSQKHLGQNQLLWPTSRAQALELLDYFCRHCLPNFGRFQDAMTANHSAQWSLYHSRLSFALNSKMIHPMQVITQALEHFKQSNGVISIAQVEGFIRQILGWREYIRAVYWVNMPEYTALNSLDTSRKLPDYFWTGETKMACMHAAIKQSLDFAYAHHIQRLMVTGNFCLLAGIDVHQVDEWYLGIYIDAIEWVELPNTRGMSQFGDGGMVATKPYAASGNYINKMSDYCKGCHYDVKQKTGDSACPFNSLYWDFMLRHRNRFKQNPRIAMLYKNWEKQASDVRDATLQRAEWCLDNIEQL